MPPNPRSLPVQSEFLAETLSVCRDFEGQLGSDGREYRVDSIVSIDQSLCDSGLDTASCSGVVAGCQGFALRRRIHLAHRRLIAGCATGCDDLCMMVFNFDDDYGAQLTQSVFSSERGGPGLRARGPRVL